MFWRRRQRLEEELESHLEHEVADNMARGLSARDARNAALRTVGNTGVAKERARELDPLYWLDTLWQDTCFAVRLMARNRWTSLTIVATLTAGIALNVSVFTLLKASLLNPWIKSEPESFVKLIPRFSGQYKLRYSDGGLSQPDYVLYRDSAKSLQSLAAYWPTSVVLGGDSPGRIRGALVSCNVFEVARPGPPLLGRYLTPDECTKPGESAVAVISETAWRARFNADPGITGKVIHLNRIPFTVVGVAPGALPVMEAGDLVAPYSMLGALRKEQEFFGDVRAQWLNVIGRRRPGYSLDQVRQEMSALARRTDERVPGRVTTLHVTNGAPIQEPEMRGRASIIFAITLGTTTLLLLLACVNVTTLLLARSAARQREISLRLSLGAGRFRLLRQLLTESLVPCAIAAVLSFVIARHAPAALWESLTASPPPFDVTLDWGVMIYGLGIALTAAVIAGLSPALESIRPNLAASLKSGSSTPEARRSRLRSVLVAVQVALSLVLLVEAGLFTRAQRRFFSHDPGFETRQVLNVSLSSVLSGFEPPESFYRELQSRVGSLPGVQGTSYASIAPWLGRNSTAVREVDGRPLPETRDFRLDPARRVVSWAYFTTLSIPLTRGRAFTAVEEGSKPEVIPTVISEAMAQRYWPGRNPLGRQFRITAIHEVIGVTRDLQSVSHMQDDGPFYYVPLDPVQSKPRYLLVRVGADTESSASAIRGVVRQLDPQMAATVETLASVVQAQGERMKPVMVQGVIAGLIALLLALTGVYAVVSFSVSQRIREIGVRVALGAERRDIITLVLRTGLVPVVVGLGAGFALALAGSSVMKLMLSGLNPRDPLTFAAVPLLLLLAALGAILIPARRAASLDPLRALRYE